MPNPICTFRRVSSRQRGSAYVLVLSVAMLIGVIGVAVGVQARVDARQARLVGDGGEAQTLAMSAMEYAVFKIDKAVQTELGGGAPWRNQFTDSHVVGPIAFGNGSFTYMLKDATGDGNLANDPLHGVEVYVTASVGRNVQKQKLLMKPGPAQGATSPPMPALGYGAFSDKKITFTSCTVNGDGTLASNAKVDAYGASVHADVESSKFISGGSYYGTLTSYAWPYKPMPNTSVFDFYINNGTAINYSDLVSYSGSKRWIWGELLSPNRNPFGATNPKGIYVINCFGNDIGISESRIVGTLVLINPGPGSAIEGPINWEPAVHNYPSLLVKGQAFGSYLGSNDITFRLSDTPLRESSTVWGTTWLATYLAKVPNFNRSGTPWQGNTDLDTLDEYVSGIAGLIYVEGELNVSSGPYGNAASVNGIIMAGELLINSGATLNVYHNDKFYNDPPPGFASGSAPPNATAPMQIVEGSWRRVFN